MRQLLTAGLLAIASTIAAAPVARATPIDFQLALTATHLSGNPAGLSGLTLPHTFNMDFALDSSALQPNLFAQDVTSNLSSLSLTLGSRSFTTADFTEPHDVLVTTDASSNIIDIGFFNSVVESDFFFARLEGDWLYNTAQNANCNGSSFPTGSNCIGGLFGSVTLTELTAVPEPSSVALLGVGLFGLGVLRRRRIARILGQPIA